MIDVSWWLGVVGSLASALVSDGLAGGRLPTLMIF